MTSEVLSALIGAVVAVVTCLINNKTLRDKENHAKELQIIEMRASLEQSIALIQSSIGNLTAHVNQHNNLVERMYNVESIQIRMKDMIDDLRKDVDDGK